MLTGDYSIYFGKWKVQNYGEGSRLSIELSVDWDIPSFEKIIGPILEKKTKKIIRGFMAAIKLRAQKQYVVNKI